MTNQIRLNLAFQKTRLRGAETIIINVPVPDEQLEWPIARFVAHSIVENQDELSILWKKNLKTDGEAQLAKRLCLSYMKPEKDGSHTVHLVKGAEETKKTILFACLMSENVTVHVGLAAKSHLFNDPTLRPIPRINKKK